LTRIETIAEGVTDKWVTIYALCEPIGKWRVGEPRYVGKTIQHAGDRQKAHIRIARRAPRLPVHWWLKRQLDTGATLCLTHLEHVPPGGDWAERERYWITKLRSEGARLLNMTEGGEGLAGLRMAEAHKAKIAAALRTGATFSCQRCGKLFWRKRRDVIKGHNKFCSRECSNRRHHELP